MISVVETGPWAALLSVLVMKAPCIIRALTEAYVAIKRVNFETKEKRPPK